MRKNNNNTLYYKVPLNTGTLFILSTSASQSSIKKHNTALQSLGVNFAYFSFAREISPQAYANLLKSPIVRGGAVTGQGLKTGIIPYLDEIDKAGKKIGAVNTVINNEGKLCGYNTDAFGFEEAIRKHIKISKLKIKTAIIYGYGGVAGVAAQVLKKMGVKVSMAGRNMIKCRGKMKKLGLIYFKGPYDLAINATPVSSDSLNKAVGFLEILKESQIIFDHNMPGLQGKSNYLKEYCVNNKKYFIPGKEMYIPQMIKQWKIFLDGITDKNGRKIIISEEDIKKHWKIEK